MGIATLAEVAKHMWHLQVCLAKEPSSEKSLVTSPEQYSSERGKDRLDLEGPFRLPHSKILRPKYLPSGLNSPGYWK